MVVKKLIENGAYRKLTDELPRLLYTGTGGEYILEIPTPLNNNKSSTENRKFKIETFK